MAKKKATVSRKTDHSVSIQRVANGYTVTSTDKNFNSTTHIAKTKTEATALAEKKLR